MIEDAKSFWVIESGPATNPLYFCMKYMNKKIVWSPSIYDAQTFKSENFANSVLEEWALLGCRICEHGII